MLNNYQITLGVVLIGNVMTTIVASTFIANIVGQFVEEDILTFLSFMIAIFLLIFCEYLPKSLARKRPIK
jgi:Mg2+/Co2+ transporter CorB